MLNRTQMLMGLCLALTMSFGGCSDEGLVAGTDTSIGADADGGTNTSCVDGDSDGYFKITAACPAGNDCDDTNSTIHPAGTEICGDGIDQSCSGGDLSCGCSDDDADGFFALSADCPEGNDCNDLNSDMFPGNTDICGDGIDQDCSGADLECECIDSDKDGYFAISVACPTGNDCDDLNEGIHPEATDICGDGVDQDCLAGDAECTCIDADGDGYGEGPACLGPDCYDNNKSAFPGAAEICGDGIDQNCDGADEACPDDCDEASDTDNDGYGSASGCNPKDCDDTTATISPEADEICGDGIDQDCDGKDLECPAIDCLDFDGDGYGVGTACKGTDCNDEDSAVNADAAELCGDGIDNDCKDGDEACPITCVDADEDGAFAIASDCAQGTDCDDTKASVKPDALEICGDGLDNDCSDGDATCEVAGCTSDNDCAKNFFCDTTGGECLSIWDWWAPTVYLDTNENAGDPAWDYFTTVNYDGDWVAGNNWDNVEGYWLTANTYTTFVKTDTHWYIGYYFFFPRRWSVFGNVGIQYENTMRSVLLVVRQDGGKGILEVMETDAENSFYRYTAEGSELVGLSDGTIKFDTDTGHQRPIVFIEDQTHRIYGHHDWDTAGFPGENGIVFQWSHEPEEGVEGLIGEYKYGLLDLGDELWSRRFDIGDTKLFDPYGQFAGDDASSKSRAPWGLYDSSLEPSARRGEVMYDPAAMIKRHFSGGWGPFKTQYTHNHFAVRVDIEQLEISDDLDGFGQGGNDPYINLYMRDGVGNEHLLLSEAGGVIANWQADDIDADVDEPVTFALKEDGLLVHYWFYGTQGPEANTDYFGIQVREDDGLLWDDWFMDPEETAYFTFSGTQVLDFGTSKVTVKVTTP